MQVILLRDVAKIGRRFEVKEVPSGHAQNFLIPRKLAEPATPEALRRLAVEMKKKTIMSDRHDTSFKSVLDALKSEVIEIRVSANEHGHLFKGIHEGDIVKHLASLGHVISEKEVKLDAPIKQVGEHTITLMSGETKGSCTLQITKA